MSENILVVEYEPRWADLVRQALVGQTFQPLFAKDGEEAIRALDGNDLPRAIVLSSVVPKISAPDLIRAIRGRDLLQKTPILLTVSGYKGTAPRQDAARMGASDILTKPYTASEFLTKIQELLGIGGLTSSDIFGDIFEDAPVAAAGETKAMSSKSDVDKMLEERLADVRAKKSAAPAAKPKASPPNSDLDKRYQDTLSGLEKSARRTSTSPGTVPVPAPVAAPVPPKASTAVPETVPVSQPVFHTTPAPVAAAAPAIVEDEPTDGVAFGQYVLLEKIAAGGMAEVWKARMRGVEGFQKIVAIKKILPHLSDNQEFIEMFIDEAKLAAHLNHNNIIHIYDLGKIVNSYYIAMEYVDGHDLKTILKQAEGRGQPLQPELALFIASKIAAALDYAHRKRDYDKKEMELVHRDVSPQNILISQDGDIKLCDFGIAKAATKASHTQVGALKGKLQYMSPEQASAKAIDRRSDIFALGTVLFEMLTGRKLFTGESEMSILEQVREARVVPPSQFNDEISADIDRITYKSLQKDPDARYQTAGDMARDIDSILYTYRPTPASADLAIYMHHVWSAESVRPPQPQDQHYAEPQHDVSDLAHVTKPGHTSPGVAKIAAPIPPPVAAAPATVPVTTASGTPMPAWEAPAARSAVVESHREKKSPVVPIAIAAVLIAAIVGAFLFVRGRGNAAASPAAPAATVAANRLGATPATTNSAITDSTTIATSSAGSTTAQGALDPNLVNQEVAKRLAAERARLEQQQRAQQQTAVTATTAAPISRPAPILQQTPPPSQTVAPPPVQTTSAAPPPPQTATQAPAPQPEAPAAEPTPAPARVREGDLVPVGTDGLVPGRVLRRGSVPYPPLAKQQRVQGTVLVSVLVSEAGRVLEVKILRGINRPVGLNEAAAEMMRRSEFSAPTKDGVRVKSWTTVPVDFKL